MDDDDDFLEEIMLSQAYFLFFHDEKKEQAREWKESLSPQQRRNRKGVYRRYALAVPSEAPFWRIYNCGQDDAMVTLTGFNIKFFCTTACSV